MAIDIIVQDEQVTISIEKETKVQVVEKEIEPELQAKTTTENGVVYPDEGFDGLSHVSVSVEPPLQDVTIEENGTFVANDNYYGIRKVTVDVETEPVLQEKTATENGEIVPDEGFDGLSKVVVDVMYGSGDTEPTLQDATFTENGTYSPDEGFYGFGQVVVEVEGGGGTSTYLATATVKETELDYTFSLTIPELIDANYFIIKGNYMTAYQIGSLTSMDDSGVIHSLFYLNGKMFLYHAGIGTSPSTCDMESAVELEEGWSFDATTGTITFDEFCFNRYTTDETEGDVVYTVYAVKPISDLEDGNEVLY